MPHRFTVQELRAAFCAGLAEWLFAFLPLVIVCIVMVNKKDWGSFWGSSEWSFGACILSGQAVVRFVYGVAHAKRVSLQKVMLGVSLLVVVVLGPVLVVLVLVLLDTHKDEHHTLSAALAIAQNVGFWISSVVYLAITAAAHLVAESHSSGGHDHSGHGHLIRNIGHP